MALEGAAHVQPLGIVLAHVAAAAVEDDPAGLVGDVDAQVGLVLQHAVDACVEAALFVSAEHGFDARHAGLAALRIGHLPSRHLRQQVGGLHQGFLHRLAHAGHELVGEQLHRQQHRHRGDHHVADEEADEEVQAGLRTRL